MPPYKEYKFKITDCITLSVWAYSEWEATQQAKKTLDKSTDFEITK